MTDATDLIERLRALSRADHSDFSIGNEAADEIERLTKSEQIEAQIEARDALLDFISENGTAAEVPALLAELDRLTRERDEKATKLANLQVAFHDWKVFHSTVRIKAENERLREWIASDIRRPGRIRAHRNR